MGQPHPLQTPQHGRKVPLPLVEPSPVSLLDEARCALCGSSLVGQARRYHLVSPLVAMGPVTVCHMCRRAALSEGYRPAD